MLHIILMILKIIGIILLILLALLLVAVAAVLFVPVKYRFAGNWLTSLNGDGRASWLFHILSARIRIVEGALKARVRLFGFLIFSVGYEKDEKKRERKRRKRLKKRKRKEKRRRAKEAERGKREDKPNGLLEKSADKPFFEKSEEPEEEALASTKPWDASGTDALDGPDEEPERMSRFSRLKKAIMAIIHSIKAIFRKICNLKYTLQKICDTIKGMINRVSSWKEWWESEETRAAYVLCRERLVLMLRHLKPQVFKLNLTYGTGDPASTGKILAFISMIYPIFQDNIQIEPHFDEAVLNGDVKLKGRIRAAVLLWHAFKIYKDKNFKHALKAIRRSL